ncbi:MAG: hypothetical protein GXY58_08865 [Planctomycetaceae bacterium]|nr:hypothetical protein [Planctomycetaceae bacterium]
MIPLLIGILLLILFIVAIVLSVSTWRAWHIVAACMTFLAAVGLVIVASLTLKTHNHWRKTHADVSKQAADAAHEGRLLAYGDPTVVASPTPSVDDLQHQLNRALLDRGRVWRRCTPGVPANNAVQVSTVPPTETGEPGDPNTAPPNGIAVDMVLYAFLEDVNRMPVAYLGEFLVTDAQPTGVTLQPTLPMDQVQQSQVTIQPAFWTLYEMMPIDSHQVFSDEDTMGQILDDTPKPVYGAMDEQNLRTIFAAVTGQPGDSQVVTELVMDYLKDGSPAGDQDVNQSPENIWLKLEFRKDHKERVDSSNPDAGMAGNYFDPEGYAEVSALRHGEEAAVRAGDIGIFPYALDEHRGLVDRLTSSETCRVVGPVYIRSLRDYEHAFHDIQDRFTRAVEATRRAQRDVDALKLTIIKTQEQIAYRQDERSKLQQDQQGFERDKAQLTELVAALESQKTALRDELSNLFKVNLALEQQLTDYNARLTEEINQRAAAVAVVPHP